jgi:CBS domain containing-hemolysin-like protein
VEVVEDDVDTVGGLVFSRHGTVPEVGTEVFDEVHGLQFKVEEMDGRRVERVTVSKVPLDDEPAESE